jgi:hypothetical protein
MDEILSRSAFVKSQAEGMHNILSEIFSLIGQASAFTR